MSKATRRDIAGAILELSKQIPEAKLARGVAAYVVAERRTNELDAILREVARLRQEQTGLVEATVTSAYPVNEKVKKQLRQLLGKDKMIINEVIDKDVIGGVRMETSEASLDLTVRNRLNKLKMLSA